MKKVLTIILSLLFLLPMSFSKVEELSNLSLWLDKPLDLILFQVSPRTLLVVVTAIVGFFLLFTMLLAVLTNPNFWFGVVLLAVFFVLLLKMLF